MLTEWEASVLKEGLIKFQPYIKGETILMVTDHATLTWSKTFQNVNQTFNLAPETRTLFSCSQYVTNNKVNKIFLI